LTAIFLERKDNAGLEFAKVCNNDFAQSGKFSSSKMKETDFLQYMK